jgi:hypothetical protein
MGRPIRSIRHFLKDVRLPRGARYALLTTEMAPQPNKKTGVVRSEEEICRFQHVRPIMIEILQHKGLVKVAEEKVYVTDLKGPLEDGWQAKVDAFADAIAAMDHSGTAKAS